MCYETVVYAQFGKKLLLKEVFDRTNTSRASGGPGGINIIRIKCTDSLNLSSSCAKWI